MDSHIREYLMKLFEVLEPNVLGLVSYLVVIRETLVNEVSHLSL
jgi:hypothetical protein